MTIQVSIGEFLDRLSILEIKSRRIHSVEKLQNIHTELSLLRSSWQASPLSKRDIYGLMLELREVNNALWDIENRIRDKEAAKAFDAEFIELARSVYTKNDRRSAIKRELNTLLGSELVEEKSYYLEKNRHTA